MRRAAARDEKGWRQHVKCVLAKANKRVGAGGRRGWFRRQMKRRQKRQDRSPLFSGFVFLKLCCYILYGWTVFRMIKSRIRLVFMIGSCARLAMYEEEGDLH